VACVVVINYISSGRYNIGAVIDPQKTQNTPENVRFPDVDTYYLSVIFNRKTTSQPEYVRPLYSKENPHLLGEFDPFLQAVSEQMKNNRAIVVKRGISRWFYLS
jgi:hypothetical protein